jgi:hypothetical protein
MRAGKFRVSIDLLKQVLSLPDDIVVLGIEKDNQNQSLVIYAASELFPDVIEGGLITAELSGIVNTETCDHGGIIKRWTEWS